SWECQSKDRRPYRHRHILTLLISTASSSTSLIHGTRFAQKVWQTFVNFILVIERRLNLARPFKGKTYLPNQPGSKRSADPRTRSIKDRTLKGCQPNSVTLSGSKCNCLLIRGCRYAQPPATISQPDGLPRSYLGTNYLITYANPLAKPRLGPTKSAASQLVEWPVTFGAKKKAFS